tara:strand:+ start:451 stop:693 length:243 start_codon:yes stop_codon:yes gene_type:complete
MEFEKAGIIHFVEKIPHECNLRFKERAGFISELYTRWSGDYNRLVQLSKIWSSIKYDGTTYAKSIEKSIQILTKDSDYEL